LLPTRRNWLVKQTIMRIKMTKMVANNYLLGQDDMHKLLYQIMKEHDTNSIFIGKEEIVIMDNDRKKSLEQFMKERNIKKTEVQQLGYFHTCSRCGRSDAPFSNPHSIHCKPCHNEYQRDYNKRKKEGHVPKKIKRKQSYTDLIVKTTNLEKQVVRLTECMTNLEDKMDEIMERLNMIFDKMI